MNIIPRLIHGKNLLRFVNANIDQLDFICNNMQDNQWLDCDNGSFLLCDSGNEDCNRIPYILYRENEGMPLVLFEDMNNIHIPSSISDVKIYKEILNAFADNIDISI